MVHYRLMLLLVIFFSGFSFHSRRGRRKKLLSQSNESVAYFMLRQDNHGVQKGKKDEHGKNGTLNIEKSIAVDNLTTTVGMQPNKL